ncbi:MAG: ABC transporter ATP-binding protein/permease, partial [Coprobacillaceae bacterium]
ISESAQSVDYIKRNVAMQLLSLMCNITLTVIFSYVLASVINNQPVEDLWLLLGIGILVIIARYQFVMKASFYSHKSSEVIKLVLREKLYLKILELGSSYRDVRSTAELVQLSVEGIEQLDIYFAKYIPQFMYAMIAPLILLLVIAPFSVTSAFVLFICVPLIPVSIVFVQKIAKRILSKYWDDYTGLGNTFLDSISGLVTLKVFQSDEYQNQKMNVEAEHFRKSTMRVLIMQLNSISVMDIVAYGGAGLGIIVGLNQLSTNEISVFSAILIILLSAEFFIPMRLLGSFFHIAMNGKAASDKIYSLLDMQVVSSVELVKCKDVQAISITDVNFGFDVKTLDAVNLEFKTGLNAIVGPSGSGKSTIAKLLMKMYKGYQGKILINNEDLQAIDPSNYISLVKHDSYIFKGTIRSNLLIVGDYSDEVLKQTLDKVALLDFVEESGGLDMSVAAGGSNLSGGQKQRLTLARTILADRPIIIFDEATSNIDIESERIINNQIAELSKSKLVIVIAHRLRSIVKSQTIFVIDGGKVIERGNHQQLLSNKNLYNRMYIKQSELEKLGGSDDE